MIKVHINLASRYGLSGERVGDYVLVAPINRPMSIKIPGPGAELKELLAWFGFKSKPGCVCNKRARYMDKMGCDWCERNVGEIVGWLKQEHARQKVIVPFVSVAAEQLVRLAIRRARKKGNSQ